MNPIPVLLVEDDADLSAALAEYLDINGCAVAQADSALAFYRLVERMPELQVAIIDIGLPDQSGLVLADYARHNTHISVIVVTANDHIDHRVESYHTGADLYLAKPIDNRELLAAVRAMAARYSERHGALSPEEAPAGTAWELDRARRQLAAPILTAYGIGHSFSEPLRIV